jgi:hypothetical protein
MQRGTKRKAKGGFGADKAMSKVVVKKEELFFRDGCTA